VTNMTGILKIHCLAAGPGHLGHCWLEYSPIDGQPHTFSTWGNNPRGRGSGLLLDMDLGRKSHASRAHILDSDAERRLMGCINHYRLLGEAAWQPLAPCSAFAADVWHEVTGEFLPHRAAYISNPTTLANSIHKANSQSNDRIQAPASGTTQLPDKKLGRKRNRPMSRR
jgi:hypothetical protein